MSFESVWRELRDRCGTIDPDAALVTPGAERPFAVASTDDDRIVIRWSETDEERTLWRTGFEVLDERIRAEGDGLSVADLPPGAEPYVSVLSLSPAYAVDESRRVVRRAEGDERPESPFLRPAWETRTRPERVHDDAVLLADLLARRDVGDLEDPSEDLLVDLYVLLSDVQRGADGLRRTVGDALLRYVGPDGRVHGRFGTVTRTVRERRRVKDEETVLEALDDRGIPREWVLGVDPEKLDVVLAVTDLAVEEVYDVDEGAYVQKTGVDEAAKQSRLQGLRDRLDDLAGPEAAELREEIDALEDRLDALLAAG